MTSGIPIARRPLAGPPANFLSQPPAVAFGAPAANRPFRTFEDFRPRNRSWDSDSDSDASVRALGSIAPAEEWGRRPLLAESVGSFSAVSPSRPLVAACRGVRLHSLACADALPSVMRWSASVPVSVDGGAQRSLPASPLQENSWQRDGKRAEDEEPASPPFLPCPPRRCLPGGTTRRPSPRPDGFERESPRDAVALLRRCLSVSSRTSPLAPRRLPPPTAPRPRRASPPPAAAAAARARGPRPLAARARRRCPWPTSPGSSLCVHFALRSAHARSRRAWGIRYSCFSLPDHSFPRRRGRLLPAAPPTWTRAQK